MTRTAIRIGCMALLRRTPASGRRGEYREAGGPSPEQGEPRADALSRGSGRGGADAELRSFDARRGPRSRPRPRALGESVAARPSMSTTPTGGGRSGRVRSADEGSSPARGRRRQFVLGAFLLFVGAGSQDHHPPHRRVGPDLHENPAASGPRIMRAAAVTPHVGGTRQSRPPADRGRGGQQTSTPAGDEEFSARTMTLAANRPNPTRSSLRSRGSSVDAGPSTGSTPTR